MSKSNQIHLFPFMQAVAESLRSNGKIRTAETYMSTLRCFSRFRNGKDIPMRQITPHLLNDFQQWMWQRGLSSNTTSFYCRILRAVYNRAIEYGIIPDANPFRRIYTGIAKTRKRALNIDSIRHLKQINLSSRPEFQFARDMFLLGFAMRGISLIDLAFLRKSDIRDGYITYSRRKTGQTLSIRCTADIHNLLSRYPAPDSPFLLPIINHKKENYQTAYRSAACRINRHLKHLGHSIGLQNPLTYYCARHSWASAALSLGITTDIISRALGHDSENTTRIYLAMLDSSPVDAANETILAHTLNFQL